MKTKEKLNRVYHAHRVQAILTDRLNVTITREERNLAAKVCVSKSKFNELFTSLFGVKIRLMTTICK